MVLLRIAVFTAVLSGIILLFAKRSAFTATAASNSPYSQWSNGPSPDPNFFPIGVWLQSPSNVQEFKNIGINLFIGFDGSLDQTSLSQMAAAQVGLLPSQNSVGLTSLQNTWVKGWDSYDEPDNAQPNGSGGYGPCIAPSQVVASYNAIRANDTTRPVFLNFGQGAADIQYIGRGSCNGDTAYYPQAISGGDLISFDIYPVKDHNGQLELVAEGVTNLRAWSNNNKIIWNFIEGCPSNAGATPSPAQERAEVWMSIVHGSQGIVYFVHQFQPTFREDGIFNYPALVQAVKQINAQITSLAPVLNSSTIAGDVTVASDPTTVLVDIMEKKYGGSSYVFAVAMRNNSATVTFTTPGVQSGLVNVIDENRQLPITAGRFQDSFIGYAVHLYQFSAGTSSPPAPPTGLGVVVH